MSKRFHAERWHPTAKATITADDAPLVYDVLLAGVVLGVAWIAGRENQQNKPCSAGSALPTAKEEVGRWYALVQKIKCSEIVSS